ncbi:asparagine synthetase B family protein [Mobilicoccus pelagius]|uniref:asparagine synthetase B family protein n=1 Tax=Mobilicoccus pelagius TaxID=746032 RepID=UPI000317A012|nr:asparagine synthetase B family protein [Mobilicoccus pelagius]
MAALVGAPHIGADVDAAAAAIAGRGPDGVTRWSDESLLLVSSRLGHWDEGTAQQPFVDGRGGVAAFNGELFNLVELQDVLGRPGASEVEVLLAGVQAQGPEFLRRVDGQFALVARCTAEGPVLLARDRFGIAPLYWAQTPGGVAAGSDLGAVLALRGGDATANPAGLTAILAEWAPTGELTPFEGVHQVPPGHVVTVTPSPDGVVLGVARWVPPIGDPRSGATCDEAALDALERAVRDSVRARLRSTGTVACLLSGGIDSTIVGGFAREEGADLGLALCLQGDDLVGERQREVADALGMRLVQHELTPGEVVDTLAHYVSTRRVPLVRLGPVGMTALARRAARGGIRGVLSGEGADELFAGYDSYRLLAARAGAFGDPKRLPWAAFGAPEFGADRGPVWARSYWRGLVAFSTGAGARRVDILRPVADLLRPPLREAVLEPAAAAPMDGTGDPLEARRRLDVENLLGAYLLTVQGDHAWMEEGVELRPPYLAAPVAEWASARPVTQFVRIDQGKVPVRALLPRLAQRRPALAGLGFAKAAFRVDVSFVQRDPAAFDRLAEYAAACPDRFVDHDALTHRIEQVRAAGACSEAESELLTFAASLGILANS